MGEAKRRKKILGEAYGTQATSGKWKKAKLEEASETKETSLQLEKAKRLLAIEWDARIEMKLEEGRYVKEDFDPFKNILFLEECSLPLKPDVETKALLLDHINTQRKTFWELFNHSLEDLKFPEDSEDLNSPEVSEDLEILEQSFFGQFLFQGVWKVWLNQTLSLYLALKDKEGFEEESKALKQVLLSPGSW
jgi:hypothetical protein